MRGAVPSIGEDEPRDERKGLSEKFGSSDDPPSPSSLICKRGDATDAIERSCGPVCGSIVEPRRVGEGNCLIGEGARGSGLGELGRELGNEAEAEAGEVGSAEL